MCQVAYFMCQVACLVLRRYIGLEPDYCRRNSVSHANVNEERACTMLERNEGLSGWFAVFPRGVACWSLTTLDDAILREICGELGVRPSRRWTGRRAPTSLRRGLHRERVVSVCSDGELFGAADIAQGGLWVGVAEKLLDDEQGRLVYGHVGADGVTDGVWGDGLDYAGGANVLLDYVLYGAGGQGLVLSDPGSEQGLAGVGVGVEAAPGEQDVALDEPPELG